MPPTLTTNPVKTERRYVVSANKRTVYGNASPADAQFSLEHTDLVIHRKGKDNLVSDAR